MYLKKMIVVNLSLMITAGLAAAVYGQDVSVTSSVVTMENLQEDIKGESGNTEIQKVILPTDTEDIFDFIIDPQRLITITGAAAYDGETFEKNATLFFKRSDGGVKEDYYSSSDVLTISNQGDTEVEVVLTAKIASLGGVQMTDDNGFTDDTRPSLYLALTDGERTAAIDEKEGATIRAMIPANADGGSTYGFQLTGAANDKGDWGKIGKVSPKITVTWQVIPISEERDNTSGVQDGILDEPEEKAPFREEDPAKEPEAPEELPQEGTPTEPE